MHTDLEALETVCKHYRTEHGSQCLRQQKNKVRCLQRRLAKAEAEIRDLKVASNRWKQACIQWRESYAEVSVHVLDLSRSLQAQHWL